MKSWQFWSLVVGMIASLFTLGAYGYNISSFAATVASRVGFLEKQREEDKQDIKENLNYIRQRVDEIAKQLQEKK